MKKDNLMASQQVNDIQNKIFSLVDKNNENKLLRTHITAILEEAIYPIYDQLYLINKKIKTIEKKLNSI